MLYVAMICEPVSGCGFIFPRKDSPAIVHEGLWVLLERTTTVAAVGFTPRPVVYVAMICEPVSGCGFIFPRKDSLAIMHEGPWVLLLGCCAAV